MISAGRPMTAAAAAAAAAWPRSNHESPQTPLTTLTCDISVPQFPFVSVP